MTTQVERTPLWLDCDPGTDLTDMGKLMPFLTCKEKGMMYNTQLLPHSPYPC